MTSTLEQSYAYCRRVARSRARNFYYSFVLLPKAERDAMCALYAFMRYCDDLSDEPHDGSEEAAAKIAEWRTGLTEALAGNYGPHLVWPAFHATVNEYGIPHQYFYEMIDGVSSDLDRKRFETFEELYHYCYQVASIVGLSLIHILGFESPEALMLAEKCGVAFQLTNILRDVREDAERGRIYLPAEDLKKFQVNVSDLLETRRTHEVLQLLQFEGERAKTYYEESRPLIRMVPSRTRSCLWALIEIYRRLLERIESSGYDVFGKKVRLSAWEKGLVVMHAALGHVSHRLE